MDLMEQRLVILSGVSIFVLDEADRMLDMGFINPIRRIAAALPPARTVNRQTLLFSATMPKEIMKLAESMLHDPVKIAVTPVASMVTLIEQSLYMVPRMQKQALLEHLLADRAVERVLVFTKTKHGADKVAKRLKFAGVSSDAIHGNKAQNARTRALDGFRSGKTRVLVATDVAARGLDVDDITHVINYDLPMEPEAYVHHASAAPGHLRGPRGLRFSSLRPRGAAGLLRDIERLTGQEGAAGGEAAGLACHRACSQGAASPTTRASSHGQSHGHAGSRLLWAGRRASRWPAESRAWRSVDSHSGRTLGWSLWWTFGRPGAACLGWWGGQGSWTSAAAAVEAREEASRGQGR